MRNMLLVEDSSDCYEIVKTTLQNEFEVTWATSVKDSVRILEDWTPDIILLDVLLPDGTGYDVLTHLKEKPGFETIPVLMLTSKKELADKVLSFSMGADDYVCKPFEPLELKMRTLARVRSVQAAAEIKYYDIKIQLAKTETEIYIKNKWEKLDLTGTEYKILRYFIEHPETVFSREQILDEVWGRDVHLFPRIVDTYISRLRKKIDGTKCIIKSKNRLGYTLSLSDI
jgi:two-component system phosphate regulon response regulator PhoB